MVAAAMLFSGCVMLTSSAFAFDDQEKTIMVNINQDDDKEAVVDLKLNNQSYSFKLPELKMGETREITTDSGSLVTLTKTKQGVSVNIDGEDIVIQPADHVLHLDAGNKKANVFAFIGMDKLHNDDEILISASGLSEDDKTRIKDAIASAGISKKVIFSDPNKKLEWINKEGGNFEIEVQSDDSGNKDHKVIKLKKRIELHTDKK